MTNEEAPKKKKGRPRLYPGTERRPTLTFRVRDRMHEQLSQAAEAGGRSLSEEIERRLEESFTRDSIVEEASKAAVKASLYFVRGLFGGEKYYNFGSSAANAMQYAMHAEGLSNMPIGSLKDIQSSRNFVETYMANWLKYVIDQGIYIAPTIDEEAEGIIHNVSKMSEGG